MSHQTKYKSSFRDLGLLTKAMEAKGYAKARETNMQVTFTQQGSHPVHVLTAADGSLTISTDLHYGPGSQKIKRLLGSPENGYEALATAYNTIQMTEHFTAQGYEVTQQNLDGEVVLTIGMQEGW